MCIVRITNILSVMSSPEFLHRCFLDCPPGIRQSFRFMIFIKFLKKLYYRMFHGLLQEFSKDVYQNYYWHYSKKIQNCLSFLPGYYQVFPSWCQSGFHHVISPCILPLVFFWHFSRHFFKRYLFQDCSNPSRIPSELSLGILPHIVPRIPTNVLFSVLLQVCSKNSSRNFS